MVDEWVPLLLSIVSTIACGLQFTSLVPRAREWIRDKTVAGYPFVPPLSMMLQCFVWAAYGYLIRDYAIMGLNAYGLIIGTFYTLVYYRYMDAKQQVCFVTQSDLSCFSLYNS